MSSELIAVLAGAVLNMLGVVFSAGILWSRVKTLESALRETKSAVREMGSKFDRMAELMVRVTTLESEVKGMREGIHTLRETMNQNIIDLLRDNLSLMAKSDSKGSGEVR
jgi:hypothetical protein